MSFASAIPQIGIIVALGAAIYLAFKNYREQAGYNQPASYRRSSPARHNQPASNGTSAPSPQTSNYSRDTTNQSNRTAEPGSNEELNKTCKICGLSLELKRVKTKVTYCGHTFHRRCMDRELSKTKQCPTCGKFINWINTENKCVACLESLSYKHPDATNIPCGHRLHLECLNKLKETTRKCPICRKCIETQRPVFFHLF